MGAAVVCLIGLAVLGLGYVFYSRHLAEKVFELRDDEPVPSQTQYDGVDYVPTPKAVLFGHHYASIAGAAPIIGPAIAVVWGWAPALVWVVLGSVFMGAVHDFATLVLSMRNRGNSVGQIAETVIGPRARTLFLLVVFFLVLLVIAVFARAIAQLFVAYPGTVLPITTGWPQSLIRYVLAAPALYIFLSRWGRSTVFDRVWTTASVMLLSMQTALFAWDMWVA